MFGASRAIDMSVTAILWLGLINQVNFTDGIDGGQCGTRLFTLRRGAIELASGLAQAAVDIAALEVVPEPSELGATRAQIDDHLLGFVELRLRRTHGLFGGIAIVGKP